MPCDLAACDKSPDEKYDALIEEVAGIHPNTKVIGYPFNVANEEATLSLIDEVLNAWGR